MKYAVTFLILSVATNFSYASEDIAGDIDQIQKDIDEAREVVNADQGMISSIASVRLETLLLSKALLEREILVKNGDSADLISIEITKPDEVKVASILQDIESTQLEISNIENQIRSKGGLQGVLLRTQLETEKISLAQLKLSYYQASYGIVFPGSSRSSEAKSSTNSVETETETLAEWADPLYPEINYETDMFRYAYGESMGISGWWIFDESKAEIDDSPKVIARNLSEYRENSYDDQKYLLYQCIEGRTSIVYLTGEFLISGYDRDTFSVSLRVDSSDAVNQEWAELTNNKGAGVFGRRAEQLLRKAYDKEKLFLRLQAREKYIDASFDLAGQNRVIEVVAAACGWAIRELTKTDYKKIQSSLRTAGFYSGKVDGVWGQGSKKSLREFQKNAGLNPTGAPNEITLDELGIKIR